MGYLPKVASTNVKVAVARRGLASACSACLTRRSAQGGIDPAALRCLSASAEKDLGTERPDIVPRPSHDYCVAEAIVDAST
jgi:hypothetical protein